MAGLHLEPEAISRELLAFNEKLLKSYDTLLRLRELKVGQTPRTEVFREDKLRLYHYQGNPEARCKTPLLICYALVNRPYMVDLEPGRSFLARLLEGICDIYLIDWGYPDSADRFLDLDDYLNDYLDSCVNASLQHSGMDQLNLLGICQGGTFSLCYSALNPARIRNLVTMVTPVDFHTPDNLLTHLAMNIDPALATGTYGNIPGAMLNDTYNALMPMRLGVQKYLGIPDLLQEENSASRFLRMEQWIYDSPDQAGAAFREFVSQFFQQNLLIKGEAMIGDKRVDLRQITQPVLNVFGTHDHLVPPAASKALKQCIASQDYQELAINAGHIGVFVSTKAQQQVAPGILRWLQARD